MAKGAIYAKYLVLEPSAPAGVPNSSFFLDSTNANQPTTKGSLGALNVLQGSLTNTNKFMVLSGSIALYAPVSKRADGKIILADSDGVGTQEVIGFAMSSGVDGDLVPVLLIGPNVAGALTGLGFTTGDEIFVSETGGYTNNPNSITGDNDSIIRLGIADCAGGSASATAVDLICAVQVILRPA